MTMWGGDTAHRTWGDSDSRQATANWSDFGPKVFAGYGFRVKGPWQAEPRGFRRACATIAVKVITNAPFGV